MNFTNIYMRNAGPNNILTGFYGRFLNSISKDFDYKLLQKKHKNDNFFNTIFFGAARLFFSISLRYDGAISIFFAISL